MNNDFCNRIRVFFDNWGSNLIWIMGLGLYVFLLLMCIINIQQPCNSSEDKEQNSPPKNTLQDSSINIQINISAGKVNPKVNCKLDSVISVINEWNKYREESLNQRMSDLRQETNNVIEKQNAWLAFWIGILAIVGALIPSLLQWRNERKIDSELDRIKEQQKEAIKKQEKAIKKQEEAIEEMELPTVISQLSYTLISVVDNIRFINDNDRNKYVNAVHNDLCKKTENYFNAVKTNKDLYNIDNPNGITCLRNIILQLFTAYNACRQLLVLRYETRQSIGLTNTINKVLGNIDDIINNQGRNADNQEYNLFSDLDRLLEQMKRFSV